MNRTSHGTRSDLPEYLSGRLHKPNKQKSISFQQIKKILISKIYWALTRPTDLTRYIDIWHLNFYIWHVITWHLTFDIFHLLRSHKFYWDLTRSIEISQDLLRSQKIYWFGILHFTFGIWQLTIDHFDLRDASACKELDISGPGIVALFVVIVFSSVQVVSKKRKVGNENWRTSEQAKVHAIAIVMHQSWKCASMSWYWC